MSFVPNFENYTPASSTPMEVLSQVQVQPHQHQLLQVHPPSPWELIDQQDFSNTPSAYSASPIEQQQQFQQYQDAIQQVQETESMQPPIATLSPTEIQTPTLAPTPTYESPQVIQLIERPLKRLRPPTSRQLSDVQKQKQVPQKPRSQTLSPTTHLNTPAQTPTEQYAKSRVVSEGSSSIQWFELQGSKVAKIAKTQKRGASDARAQARVSTHPYQRHASKADSKHVMAGGTIANSSPVSSMVKQQQPAPPPKEVMRYLLRADVHYNSATNIITAMLELPGVKRSDVRIGVHVCEETKEKQIVVRGRSRPLLPEHAPTTEDSTIECYFRQERKYGEFKRVLVVPSELKPEHVNAIFEDGILFLKYPMDLKQLEDNVDSPNN